MIRFKTISFRIALGGRWPPAAAGSFTSTRIAIELAIFVAAALPGYLLAIAWLDRGLSAGLGKLGAFAGVLPSRCCRRRSGCAAPCCSPPASRSSACC